MRALLDTNIIIHRESDRIQNNDIGVLFFWLDKLNTQKCIHPATVDELNHHKNKVAVGVMNVKLENYNVLKTVAPMAPQVEKISNLYDANNNDVIDTKLLNEVYVGRVDYLISEDKKIHKKAKELNLSNKVFTITEFLEKAISENPGLVDYKVLAVKKSFFGEIDIKDKFFDSFREDYVGFDKWFNKKSDELCYICFNTNVLSAFLFVKIEDENENYSDIHPPFNKQKRLKIGTFKVTANGFKIGERFLKIIFDNALANNVNEIYVTIFDKSSDQLRLISLLEEFGFVLHGEKVTDNGVEKVYVKPFKNNAIIDVNQPKKSFPFSSTTSDIFIVPIYPQYHTELFPDSILRNESPKDFVENEPHRNAISKVYISRSWEKGLKSGDRIVFYRTGGIFVGVATTIGIVESIITNIPDEATFLQLCRKRSVFTDEQLKMHWNYSATKPFIVNFLYTWSLKKRPNLKWLHEAGVIPDINDMPRGFRRISQLDFNNIVKYSK